MSNNNYNNLFGGIKQVNPIGVITDSNRMDVLQFDKIERKYEGKKTYAKEQITGYAKDQAKVQAKNRSKYIILDNFMRPKLSNLNTIEDIKRKIKTGKITFDNTYNEEDESSKFIKTITMAPGFVYGVDTRKYYPKNNIPVGPSISDM